jgi:hypothetical protein
VKKFIAVYIVVVLSGLYSCNSSKQKVIINASTKVHLLDTAQWFIGTWQNQTSESLFTEKWEQKNDSVYIGISSVVLNNKDTTFYESIFLEQKKDSLFYIVTIKDQNKELPVSFKLISFSEKQLVFENSKHDFPSKITYLKISEDSIVASIFGILEGKEKTEYFSMKKKK